MTRQPARHAATLLAFVALHAAASSAQRVRGVVRDSVSGLPIAGAVVSALDSANHGLARTLTDARGSYTLSRSRAAVDIKVLRIGYEPRTIALAAATGDLPAISDSSNAARRDVDGADIVDVRMVPLGTRLSTVAVSGPALCRNATDA